jgi:cyanate permease
LIFGTINVALIGGGAAGPWIAGLIHDTTDSYTRDGTFALID